MLTFYGIHGGPVLSVYGYNGRYDAQSFRDVDGRGGVRTADRIATSFDNSDGWVKELDVDTNWHTGTRTMSFRIVASAVNQHVPVSRYRLAGCSDRTTWPHLRWIPTMVSIPNTTAMVF